MFLEEEFMSFLLGFVPNRKGYKGQLTLIQAFTHSCDPLMHCKQCFLISLTEIFPFPKRTLYKKQDSLFNNLFPLQFFLSL